MKTLGTMLILIATMLTAPANATEEAVESGPELRKHLSQEELRLVRLDDLTYRAGTCRLFATTDTGHEDPDALDKWVDVRVRVLAKQCMGRNGHRWVRPISATYSYNVEHAHQSCGFWDEFEGVRFDLYLSDGAGRNFHPKQVRLHCEEDTTSEHVQSLHDAPNFRYCWGVPKWKSNYTVIIDNWNDVSGVLRDSLWSFIGPVPNEC